MRYYF